VASNTEDGSIIPIEVEDKEYDHPLSSASSSLSSPRIKDPRVYKTELCEKFTSNGLCPYGEKCQFAHGEEELRPRLPLSATAAVNIEEESSRSPSPSPLQSARTDPSRYKTELCRSFNKTGYCRYGLKCQFAHGLQELRASAKLPAAIAKIGIDVPAIASDKDVPISPSSPRNLRGSPVISPRNQKIAMMRIDTDDSAPLIPPRIQSIKEAASAPLPKASPTAKIAFSFATPVSIDSLKLSTSPKGSSKPSVAELKQGSESPRALFLTET